MDDLGRSIGKIDGFPTGKLKPLGKTWGPDMGTIEIGLHVACWVPCCTFTCDRLTSVSTKRDLKFIRFCISFQGQACKGLSPSGGKKGVQGGQSPPTRSRGRKIRVDKK